MDSKTQARDTLILDPSRFSHDTHRWHVPILTFAGVDADELYIDGHPIASAHFTTKGNFLVLDETIAISSQTKASLVIKYSSRTILVSFWLPIILASLTFVSAIAQPILHYFGLLYTPEMEVATRTWAYDDDEHKFVWSLNVKNFDDDDRAQWVIYGTVREEDNSIDIKLDSFEYFGGPFELRPVMNIEVHTDAEFTARAKSSGRLSIQGPLFLVHRDLTIKKPFTPSEYPASDFKLISAHVVGSTFAPE